MRTTRTRLDHLEAHLGQVRNRPHVKKGYIGLSPGEWDGLPADWRIDHGRGYIAFRTIADYEQWVTHDPA